MKNYTSTVDAEVTIQRIEAALVRFGACHISKDYTEGEVVGILFSLKVPEAPEPLHIRLPANVDLVAQVLKSSKKRPAGSKFDVWHKRLAEQARRAAWRLMQDWIEVQLSLVEMKQAEAAQVFMPYFWDGKRTMFEALKETKYAALTRKVPA